MPLRLCVARGRLLCVLHLPERDATGGALVSELALVASLTSPRLRLFSVYRGWSALSPDRTPRAA